jgi:HAMP domain-containing protein
MAAATVSVPTRSVTWTQTLRVVIAAVAVVALLAIAFVLGRATSPSAHAATTVAKTAPVTVTTTGCRMGRPC